MSFFSLNFICCKYFVQDLDDLLSSWGTCQCWFFPVTLLLLPPRDLSPSDNEQPPAVIPQEVFAQGQPGKKKGGLLSVEGKRTEDMLPL